MKKKCGCVLLFLFLILICYSLLALTQHWGMGYYIYCRFSSQERQAYNEIIKFGGQIMQTASLTPVEYETGKVKPRWSIHLGKDSTTNKSILPLKSSLETFTTTDLWLNRGELLTDEELKVVENLDRLTFLDIKNAAITDESIPLLKELPRLNWVQIKNTRMTEQGFSDLRNYINARYWRKILLYILQNRFHDVPIDIENRIHTMADVSELNTLCYHAKRCESLEEFVPLLGKGTQCPCPPAVRSPENGESEAQTGEK